MFSKHSSFQDFNFSNSIRVNNLDKAAVAGLFTSAAMLDADLQLLVQSPSSISKEKYDGTKKEWTIHYDQGTTRLIRISKSTHGNNFGFGLGTLHTPIHSISGVAAGGVAESGGLEVGERILEM